MTTKLQNQINKCTICGTMGYVLCISQVAGLAPLTFQRVDKAWQIRYSQFINIYSFMVLFIKMLSGAILIMSELVDITANNIVHQLVWALDITLIYFIVLVAVLTGKKKVNLMIHSTAKLAQINEELNLYHHPSKSNERCTNCLVIFTLTVLCCFMTMGAFELSKHLYTVINDDKSSVYTILRSSSQVVYVFASSDAVILALQFNIITGQLLSTFQQLNKGLAVLLEEICKGKSASTLMSPTLIMDNKQSKVRKLQYHIDVSNRVTYKLNIIVPRRVNFNGGMETASDKLHHLALHYCTLCDMVRQINDSSGLFLILVLLSCLLHIIISPYHWFKYMSLLSHKTFNVLVAIPQVVKSFFFCYKIVMITEPCHKTFEQMVRIKNLLNKIRRSVQRQHDVALIDELKLFHQQMTLNQVTYKPMRLITLNRALFVTFMATVATYLTILLDIN